MPMKYNIIIKPERFEKFTIVPSHILRHRGMSVGATGLYAWLFSHDSKQQITVEFICNHFKENKTAIATKIKELIESGYLIREKVLDKGKFKGFNYILNDMPKSEKPMPEKPMSENPAPENQPQSNNNINIYNSNNNKSNISMNENVLKLYPHFLDLFPERYRPKTDAQKNKWISCLDKLNSVDGYDYHKLWQIVKFIREHEFWGEHFLSLLKLRNKDKNGVKYIDKYFETYKNANKPKFFWKINGIIKYYIYHEDGKEKLGAKTKTGDLNYFNLNQVFNKYQLKELFNYVKNE